MAHNAPSRKPIALMDALTRESTQIIMITGSMTYRSRAPLFSSVLVISATLPLWADEGQAPLAKAVIQQYCVTCHNGGLKTAGLELDSVNVDRIGERADLWERVVRKLRTGEMPPTGLPRPDKPTYAKLATELETALDAAALGKPNPGRVAVHRLIRA